MSCNVNLLASVLGNTKSILYLICQYIKTRPTVNTHVHVWCAKCVYCTWRACWSSWMSVVPVTSFNWFNRVCWCWWREMKIHRIHFSERARERVWRNGKLNLAWDCVWGRHNILGDVERHKGSTIDYTWLSEFFSLKLYAGPWGHPQAS